uniref:Uncharacterized protein n=1 Tax=Picea sitchensis TaxID=3332 RepID=A9NLW2_PICSI|nr:unknown [Picea sitchensis]
MLPACEPRECLGRGTRYFQHPLKALWRIGKTALHARKVYRLKKSQLAYGQKQVYSERPKLCAQLVLLRALLK